MLAAGNDTHSASIARCRSRRGQHWLRLGPWSSRGVLSAPAFAANRTHGNGSIPRAPRGLVPCGV
eukprot:11084375-Alexandrium_andersonii.AAC.1